MNFPGKLREGGLGFALLQKHGRLVERRAFPKRLYGVGGPARIGRRCFSGQKAGIR
ncbi:hypothetical protein D3C87_1281430 [compost metagenome]